MTNREKELGASFNGAAAPLRPRIFLISPNFTPQADSEAFCGAKLSLALLDRGADLTVLRLNRAPHDCVAWDASSLWKRLEPCVTGIPKIAGRANLRSVALGLRYRSSTWTRWIHEAVRVAKQLHAARPFDCVYSRSMPMWAHIAGYWCARALGLPWIVNVNDPWDLHLFPGVDQPVSRLYDACSRHWMRVTLRRADRVIYPCARIGAYLERLSGVAHAWRVIPHAGAVPAGAARPDGTLRLVHAGKLGRSEQLTGRRANALLGALAAFIRRRPEAKEQVRLTLVGPEEDEVSEQSRALGLEAVVHGTGRVSYERSVEWICAASVCVLIEGAMEEGVYLPSKAADYLACRRPVLALSPRVGTLADLAAHRGIVRLDPDDQPGIERELERLYEIHRRGGEAELAPAEELVRMFAPHAVADRLLEEIGGVLAGRRGAAAR